MWPASVPENNANVDILRLGGKSHRNEMIEVGGLAPLHAKRKARRALLTVDWRTRSPRRMAGNSNGGETLKVTMMTVDVIN